MNDSEKITINMSAVDLGKVDLLVQETLYSNRSDFIRTAIRNQLQKHDVEFQQAVTRSSWLIGALIYDSTELEKFKRKNERLDLAIIGLLRLGRDISPELAREVFSSIRVRGIFDASPELKTALSDRMS